MSSKLLTGLTSLILTTLLPYQVLANVAPRLIDLEDQLLKANEPFSWILTPIDEENDPVTLTIEGMPADSLLLKNIDGSSTFMWLPRDVDVGTHDLVIHLTDFRSSTLSIGRTVQITVASGPEYQRLASLKDKADEPVNVAQADTRTRDWNPPELDKRFAVIDELMKFDDQGEREGVVVASLSDEHSSEPDSGALEDAVVSEVTVAGDKKTMVIRSTGSAPAREPLSSEAAQDEEPATALAAVDVDALEDAEEDSMVKSDSVEARNEESGLVDSGAVESKEAAVDNSNAEEVEAVEPVEKIAETDINSEAGPADETVELESVVEAETAEVNEPVVETAEAEISEVTEPVLETAEAEFTDAAEPAVETAEAEFTDAAEPAVETAEAEITDAAEPAVETAEAEITDAAEPAVETAEVEITNAAEPAVETAEAESTDAAEPAVETAEAESTDAAEPAVETAEVENTGTTEPVVETAATETVDDPEPAIKATQADAVLVPEPVADPTTEGPAMAPEQDITVAALTSNDNNQPREIAEEPEEISAELDIKPVTNITIGNLLEMAINISTNSKESLQLKVLNMPAGIEVSEINTNSYQLRWKPTAEDKGNATLILRVLDSAGKVVATRRAKLLVN